MNDMGYFTGSDPLTPDPAQIGAGSGLEHAAKEHADRATSSRPGASTGGADGSVLGATPPPKGRAAGVAASPSLEEGARRFTAPAPAMVEAMNMIRAGASARVAAKACGVAASAITSAICYRGLKVEDLRKGPVWTLTPPRMPERALQMRARMVEGASLKEVAAEFGLSVGNLVRYREAIGLEVWQMARARSQGRKGMMTLPEAERFPAILAHAEARAAAGDAMTRIAPATGLRPFELAAILKATRPDLMQRIHQNHIDGRRATHEALRAKRIVILTGHLKSGMAWAEAAKAMRLSVSALDLLRPHLPEGMFPKTTLQIRAEERMALIEAEVAKGADASDLARITNRCLSAVQGFLEVRRRRDLWQAALANGSARRAARRQARWQPIADMIARQLAAGRSIAELRAKMVDITPHAFTAALDYVDPALVARGKGAKLRSGRPPAQSAVQSAVLCAPQSAAPVVRLRRVSLPSRAAAPAPGPSHFDAPGADQQALADTKGRAAAVKVWADARGLTMTQALQRWHRLPAAMKGL